MPIILFSTDLMTTSQIESTARATGSEFSVVGSEETLVQRAEQTHPDIVILDLSTPAVDAASIVARLANLPSPPRIIAFGPHVHAEKLAAAEAAGCHQVCTRGQFFAQISDILAQETN